MSLDTAIARMEAEVEELRSAIQKTSTTDWFVVHAKVLGLSHLRNLKASGLGNDAAAAGRCYKACLKFHKEDEKAEAPSR